VPVTDSLECSGDGLREGRVVTEVRVIAHLTERDPRAAADFVGRVSAFVEEVLPGTVAWETFRDEATGRWVWYEVFADEQALASYEQAVREQGLRNEAGRIFEFESVTLLTPLKDPKLAALFDQIGATSMRAMAGFAR
jgi:quinol monooxygenase YgiN